MSGFKKYIDAVELRLFRTERDAKDDKERGKARLKLSVIDEIRKELDAEEASDNGWKPKTTAAPETAARQALPAAVRPLTDAAHL